MISHQKKGQQQEETNELPVFGDGESPPFVSSPFFFAIINGNTDENRFFQSRNKKLIEISKVFFCQK